MRLICFVFILSLMLTTSAHCQQTSEDWNNKGNSLIAQDEYYKAIQAYDEAIRLDSNYTDAWINKGNALMNQERYGEAIQAYDQAIRLDSNSTDAWYNKGNALKSQGEYDQAI